MRKMFLLVLVLPLFVTAQKKQVTLEDIYKRGTFRGEAVRASFDTSNTSSQIKAADVKKPDGTPIGDLEDISPTTQPNLFIVRNGIEKIYRYSTRAYAYVYDVATKKTIMADTGKVMYPELSPDGSKLAFVEDNNLYIKNLADNSLKAVTTDGKWNQVINGNADWVYEEEFTLIRAYQWSPKGDNLAYYRFDESKVKEYQFTQFDNAHNSQYTYKYPKAGDDNSTIEIHIYNLTSGKDVKAQFEQGDIYIPRIKWTTDDRSLVVFWMNRHQNELKLLLTDPQTGASNILYQEKNKYFIDINDDWQFLKNGKDYVFTSEMNGFNQIYLYSMDGKTKTQLTKSKFDVADLNGIDEVNKRVYYTLAYPRPMDRNLFVTDFDGKKTYQLTEGEGWHRVDLNDDFTKFYDFRSDINTPQVVTLNEVVTSKKNEISAKLVKTISESAKQKAVMDEYALGKAE
ncbi:MAG TPA: DPP IV N-terminal domain-containing protein, partial [Chitinophagaceae bacterium]|nr:DPP IV N-terminal domain-containing protein [Chitinophagaceae bacterium]